ncbi:MAG: phosphoribosylglycinamide formyltransferase [candidate division Zixibacteria bacterium SM23_81]|nr:MAG: phosphoribosylglycinamide formyltransferase [candidate division Zixibacteria bacterium SM23_81]
MLRLAVLASGGGTNLQAIIDACEGGEIDAQVVLVVSNNSDAGALQRARTHGIPDVHLSSKQFDSREEFDTRLLEILAEYKADLIILAGYMKLLSPAVVSAYRHRMLNIHPALLPSFGGQGMYGIRVHQAVIESGAKFSGVTVHVVDEQYDHGPIVAQRVVPVMDDDTPEILARRVLVQEHQIYKEVIQLFAEHRVRIHDRRTRILPAK